MQLKHFDCVNGFLNPIKEIIWQTEAIYRCPLTGNVKMPMIGLKMPCSSSQPMSLSLISNENIFSLVSYTMRRFSVSQTSAFCRRFLHCDPTKIGGSLH